MAPIRYSLHYEDYSEHLMSRFGKLLQIQSLVDMTLMCSSHTLRVHKAVLAASSAYFQEVLQKQTGEPLIILKMRFSVLKSLVEFMYCGKTQCLEENLDELVSAAQFLKIKGLSKVTKEGLGIANTSELPVFTPPVVINRPPQSLIGLHSQDISPAHARLAPPAPPPHPAAHDSLRGPNTDMVVRIPFDIEKGGGVKSEYGEGGPRALKPRRGRPIVRHRGGGAGGGGAPWDAGAGAGAGAGALGRAAERALMRREHDSRKAIHQLKHMQTRYTKDYMDRVTLSQAVSSICGPESAPGHGYLPPMGSMGSMGMDHDFMYLDQPLPTPGLLDAPYAKDTPTDTLTSSYTTPSTSANETVTSGVGSAMSRYVNALKSAGLPTDLPILFESGDGSYINVNEQVLLDMVQSNEIQYEVIEQPNIIEHVADPSGIKSIDDLSKSIERGEMMINKNYRSSYDKDQSQYRHDDALTSLNSILPDNLESYAEQPNYVVLDQGNNNPIDHSNDFCIDGDMQFFTKSMSDDVKKYYEGQVEQLCPTSNALDTSFNMSLLKSSHLESGQYTNEDMRRNDDYDFGLQLTQSADYKDDALDCLINIPKPGDHQAKDDLYEKGEIDDAAAAAKAQEEIIKDLMNIETDIQKNVDDNTETHDNPIPDYNQNAQDFNDVFAESNVNGEAPATNNEELRDVGITGITGGIQWDNVDINKDAQETYNLDSPNNEITNHGDQEKPPENQFDDTENFKDPVIDLTSMKPEKWDGMEDLDDKENNQNSQNCGEGSSNLEDDIPFAVGLQPMKSMRADDNSLLKRNYGVDLDLIDDSDAKCLKRKVKYKKM